MRFVETITIPFLKIQLAYYKNFLDKMNRISKIFVLYEIYLVNKKP
jgi:hypothetical protein